MISKFPKSGGQSQSMDNSTVPNLEMEAEGTTKVLFELTSVNPGAVSTAANLSNQSFDKFTLFPRLPIEIRLMVWELTLPGPRKITLQAVAVDPKSKTRYQHLDQELKITTSNPVPAPLLATRESRGVFQKVYKPAFDMSYHGIKPVYYDAAQDVVLCASWVALSLFQRRGGLRRNKLTNPTTHLAFKVLAARNIEESFLLYFGASLQIMKREAEDLLEDAILFLGGNVRTVTFVHEKWDERFAAIGKEEFLDGLKIRQKFLAKWYPRFQGKPWSLDAMPEVQHVKEGDESWKVLG